MESAEAILENENNSNVESESHIRQLSNQNASNEEGEGHGSSFDSNSGPDFNKRSFGTEQDPRAALKSSCGGSTDLSQESPLENDELKKKDAIGQEEIRVLDEVENESVDLVDIATNHDSSDQKNDDVGNEVLTEMVDDSVGGKAVAMPSPQIAEDKNDDEEEGSSENNNDCESDPKAPSERDEVVTVQGTDEKVTNDNNAEDTSVEKYLDSYDEGIDNDGEEPPLLMKEPETGPPILTKEPETETLLQFSPLGDNDLATESVPKIESYKSEGEKEESPYNSEEAPMDVENELDDGTEESVTDKHESNEDKDVDMDCNLDEEPGTKAGKVTMSQEEENWLLDENTNKIDKSETSEGRAGSEMEAESQDSDTSRGVNSSDFGDQQSSVENVSSSSQIAEPNESQAEVESKESVESDTGEAEEMELLENELSKPPEIQLASERVGRISSKESDTAPPQLDIVMNDDDEVSVIEVAEEENGGVKEIEMEKSVENDLKKDSDEPMDNDGSDLLATKDNSNDIPRKDDSYQVPEVENPDHLERQVMEKSLSVDSSNEPLEKDGKQGVSDSVENESSNRTEVESESKEDESSNGDVTVTDIKTEVDLESYVEKSLPAASKEVKKEVLNDTELGDVVIIDDKDDVTTIKKENERKDSSENGMGIAAVSGQIDGSSENKNSSEDSGKVEKASNKSKTQKCIVCHKVTKCKFNIVRGGDTKQLCDDICFKKFRKSPALFLTKTPTPAAPPSPAQTKHVLIQPKPSSVVQATSMGTQHITTISAPKTSAALSGQYKVCSVCQVMNNYTPRTFCNWKGFDFCGEICLGKFQTSMKTFCSNCLRFVPNDIRASYCMKIGNVMHPFCKQSCVQEFMKKLKTCACCKQDLSSFTPVIARVGSDTRPKEFCSKECVKKLEDQVNDVEIIRVEPSKGSVAICSVCNAHSDAAKHTVRFHTKTFKLCSDLCLSAFQYTNNINLNKCCSCGSVCTAIESQAHFIQFEGETKHFCSERCIGTFRTENRKLTACAWCAARKVNFDMIERQDENGKYQLFCSLNCLSLFRVNLQARSNLAVECDKCKTYIPAQYHLTMSDASVRNFCSYACVMSFQSQFTSRVTPPTPSQKTDPTPTQKPAAAKIVTQPRQQPVPTPISTHPHGTRNRGRKPVSKSKTPPITAAAPPIPIISSVMSLAPEDAPSDNLSGLQLQEKTISELMRNLERRGTLVAGDGKQRIVVESPLPKVMKNKALQCKPICQTKATACRPHSQHKEIQTDESRGKPVLVPIPVPIYIPMPTVMYRAPAPILVPFPVPIPVPIFIPTTRKSANGIMKAIKDIQERMPADPLEAEILLMAEAVATDKKAAGDSDTDSETDVGDNDYDAATDEGDSKPATTDGGREKGGAEDMIQMALRMAEEMSAPVEDLEASVQPVAVNSVSGGQPRPVEQSNFNHHEDPDYAPAKSTRGRGSKRQSRGRAPASSRPKRQRTGRNYSEPEYEPPEEQPIPIITEPPPDKDYKLKFTYGVNSWKHWVVAKNAELEKVNKKNSRARPLPLDVLRCTMDELHYSLCLFIKEVRKPNGEPYSPDSIYYLCLGIQQYLYENGRVDNIFTDLYFQRFTDSLHDLLKTLQPKVNNQGQMLCRIEEEHLWESKQLGAHSPYVLLNTLIYFHTKHFILKSATDHMSLSFAQILKHWKKGVPVKGAITSSSTPKNASLRFYCLANKKQDNPSMRKGKEGGVPVYEVTENFDNPLRCPVKLYEFFLSKCPESIKNRNDIFYPVPERSCVPDSPVWYSTQSIEHHTMDKMLTRILLVREIQEAHLHAQPTYLKM